MDEQILLYVEKSSGIIYEAQLFEKFVLARAATPGYESLLKKFGLGDFSTRFEEFEGKREDIERFLRCEGLDELLSLERV